MIFIVSLIRVFAFFDQSCQNAKDQSSSYDHLVMISSAHHWVFPRQALGKNQTGKCYFLNVVQDYYSHLCSYQGPFHSQNVVKL